jgi:hypothetical protein
MLLEMTHWQHRPPPDAWLSERFQRGHDIETFVVRELLDLGFELTESQMTCVVRDCDDTQLCTAHIDGRLRWNGLRPVFECKSLNPFVWAKIKSVEDFTRMGSWAAKYPRQLILYMYACDEPNGLFLLDDCLGHWKLIPVKLEDHIDECQAIIQRLRQVVDAKAAGAELPTIDNPAVCKECWAYKTGVCHPAMIHEDGISIVDDETLLEAMEVVRANRDGAKSYKDAESLVKDYFKVRGEGEYLVGRAVVTTKTQRRTAYDIPADVKQKYASESEATVTKWEFLD